MPDTSDKKPVTIDELLTKAGVPVAASAPAPIVQPTTPDGAFVGQDGRRYWRYTVNGDTLILPKPLEKMSEEDFYSLPVSLQDTLPGRVPQNLTVRFKDPQWAGYWFNKKAGSGARVATARSLGYVPAHLDEVEAIAAGLDDSNGTIEQHDLVLMKIHKAKLYMKYKEWIDKAKKLGGVDAYKNNATSYVRNAGGDLSKASYYLTPQATDEYQGLGPVANLPTVNS